MTPTRPRGSARRRHRTVRAAARMLTAMGLLVGALLAVAAPPAVVEARGQETGAAPALGSASIDLGPGPERLWRAWVFADRPSDDARRPLFGDEVSRYRSAFFSIRLDSLGGAEPRAGSGTAFFVNDCRTALTAAHNIEYIAGSPSRSIVFHLAYGEGGSAGWTTRSYRKIEIFSNAEELARVGAEAESLSVFVDPERLNRGAARPDLDFAILLFDRPVPGCAPLRLRPLEPMELAACLREQVFVLAYHGDIGDGLERLSSRPGLNQRISGSCQARDLPPALASEWRWRNAGSQTDNVIAHNCDFTTGASGSPLACRLRGRSYVAGINVIQVGGPMHSINDGEIAPNRAFSDSPNIAVKIGACGPLHLALRALRPSRDVLASRCP